MGGCQGVAMLFLGCCGWLPVLALQLLRSSKVVLDPYVVDRALSVVARIVSVKILVLACYVVSRLLWEVLACCYAVSRVF